MDPVNRNGVKTFRRRLLRWYDRYRRELPWRGTGDAYAVWLSEIMLQQTRVAVVISYYRRFIRRFPNVSSLAKASESAVLTAWSGLGYYRRARMLHRAAREIVADHQGKLPRSAAAWRELPGVGRYTAAAIASIAYGEPVAVVDGNVERVLGRLAGSARAGPVPDRQLWHQAEELLDRNRPGDFNQAMMELGATVCVPGEPLCEQCPVARWCASCTAGVSVISRTPRPRQRRRDAPMTGQAAAVQAKRRKAEIAYALALRHGHVRLRRRAATESLMPGMWELPAAKRNGATPDAVLKHSITVTDYRVLVHKRSVRQGEWVPLERLPGLPLTGVTRKILKHFQVIQ